MERQEEEDLSIEPGDALPKEDADLPEPPQADPDTDQVVEEKAETE